MAAPEEPFNQTFPDHVHPGLKAISGLMLVVFCTLACLITRSSVMEARSRKILRKKQADLREEQEGLMSDLQTSKIPDTNTSATGKIGATKRKIPPEP